MCSYDGTDDATGHRPHPAGPDGRGTPRVHHRRRCRGGPRTDARRPAAGRDAAADADRGARHRPRRDRRHSGAHLLAAGRRSTTICRWSSSTTAAVGASATWTPTTTSPAPTPSAPRPSSCRWTTDWPPNTRTRRASRMPGPRCSGSASTPPNWAATRRASRWPATRPAATSRRWSRCWPATTADRRWCFSCCGTPSTFGDTSAPSFTENADAPLLNSEVTSAFLTWYVPDLDFSDPASLPTDLAPANADSLGGSAAGVHRHRRARPAA